MYMVSGSLKLVQTERVREQLRIQVFRSHRICLEAMEDGGRQWTGPIDAQIRKKARPSSGCFRGLSNIRTKKIWLFFKIDYVNKDLCTTQD